MSAIETPVLEEPVPPAGYEEYLAEKRKFDRKRWLQSEVANKNWDHMVWRGDEIDETWDKEDLLNFCRYLIGKEIERRQLNCSLLVERPWSLRKYLGMDET